MREFARAEPAEELEVTNQPMTGEWAGEWSEKTRMVVPRSIVGARTVALEWRNDLSCSHSSSALAVLVACLIVVAAARMRFFDWSLLIGHWSRLMLVHSLLWSIQVNVD